MFERSSWHPEADSKRVAHTGRKYCGSRVVLNHLFLKTDDRVEVTSNKFSLEENTACGQTRKIYQVI